MKVWNEKGELLTDQSSGSQTINLYPTFNVVISMDDLYIRKDISNTVNAGIVIDWADPDSNFKIANGKIYIKDDTDSNWYPLGSDHHSVYLGDSAL